MQKNFFYNLLSISFLLSLTTCGDDSELSPQTKGCKNPKATNYDADATTVDNCLCKYDGINENCGNTNPSALIIPPVQQETEVWCWLAVGEMIFKYYGLPTVNPSGDYQCGIVAAVGYSKNGACDACHVNCGNCIRPAGDAATISYMLSVYPKVACRNLYNSNKTLKNSFVSNYLTESLLKVELDAKRPVIAGVNAGTQPLTPGTSAHVVVIKGYYYDGNNNFILKINDPFPYSINGMDPYVSNGAISNGDLSYQIPYLNFVNGLRWNTTWYGIGW